MGKIPFLKMHGLGNDFVVLDFRRGAVPVSAKAAAALADRRTGIGCDQLILLEPPRHPAAQVLMRIRNADGSEAEACGNATRCVADLIYRETGDPRVRIETVAGLLEAEACRDGRVAVDMGPARTGWRDIPLARAADTDARRPGCRPAYGTGLHQYRQSACDVLRRRCGRRSISRPWDRFWNMTRCFRSAPISASPRSRDRGHIRLRVWERGAGITPACGSGACAALVAAHRRGLGGPPRRGRARRRRARHLLARGRPCDHDRASGPKLRGRI